MPDPASVAVVTRTRDRTLLLDRALRSVLQQTLEDLRLIIVNDGGDPEEVETAVAAHADRARGRVMVVHHPSAVGMEAATNAGLRAADSVFVAILDDDDSWHPRFLERTVGLLEETGAMGVVTATEAIYEDIDYGDIRLFDSFRFDPMADVTPSGDQEGPARPLPPTSLFRLLSGNQFPPCSFVYRRDALDVVGEYDEQLPVLGDWDFNIRFLLHFDIEFLDQPLAYYHHRKGQSGELDNSVGQGEGLHDRVRTQLLNRYLRQDLQRGELGVGVLANLLHEQRSQRAAELAVEAGQRARMDTLEQSLAVLVDNVERLTSDGGANGLASPARATEPLRPVGQRVRRLLLGGPDTGG